MTEAIAADDLTVDIEDRSSKRWLNNIEDAERVYKQYHDVADGIDKQYAQLERLAETAGDREMQVFWANVQVLGPTIYSRPPIPVVTQRFDDRRELPRKASEILERALVADFEIDHLHDTLVMVRDDLVIPARGVVWYRLVHDEGELPRVVCDHVNRRDYLHSPARNEREITWKARRHYLTREQMRARFEETSGGEWIHAEFNQRGLGASDGTDDAGEKKAEVWEIWHKEEGVVAWVSTNVDVVLDIKPPLFNLESFFPCPRPAYGTTERSTLIPVPDFAIYKDQLEEINEYTAKIHAFTDGLDIVGFYPSGSQELTDAVTTALNMIRSGHGPHMVPIANMAALQSGGSGALVEWWPIDQIVSAIQALVELRRQVIDDVYQITGLSDIMRGATESNETATAQNLKAQYGSVRIRQRQEEMQRIARDITRDKAEIMAEMFPIEALLEMAQITDIPTQAQAMQQAHQQAEGDPQRAQQILAETVTVEQIDQLYKSQRTRPFILEIETDSTIEPNEEAEKEARIEFLGAMGQYMSQMLPVVQSAPHLAPVAGKILQFAANGFRISREIDSEIDETVDKLKEMAQQPQGPSPEQIEAEGKLKLLEQEQQAKQEMAAAEAQRKAQEAAATLQQAEAKMGAELSLKRDEMMIKAQLEREKIAATRDTESDKLANDKDRIAAETLQKAGFSEGVTPELAEQEMSAILEQLAEQAERAEKRDQVMLQLMAQMSAQLNAPKQIIRDESGRAVGVQPMQQEQMNGR